MIFLMAGLRDIQSRVFGYDVRAAAALLSIVILLTRCGGNRPTVAAATAPAKMNKKPHFPQRHKAAKKTL